MEAYAVITKPAEHMRWSGNNGYPDILGERYVFDSSVANHGRLLPGTLLILRDSSKVLGVGLVHSLNRFRSSKTRNLCPVCRQSTLSTRKLDFKCSKCDGVFLEGEVLISETPVDVIHAVYREAFSKVSNTVTTAQLEPLIATRDRQSAIRRINPIKVHELLTLLEADTKKLQLPIL